MKVLSKVALGAVAALAATPASAHHPTGGLVPRSAIEGLLSGIGHPVIGPDHLAFVLAVGLLAAMTPDRVLVIAAFVLGSLGGVVLHVGFGPLAFGEALVAATLIGLGAVFLTGFGLGRRGWVIGAAVAGILHGYAYGESIVGAEQSPLIAYLAGLFLVQAAIAGAAMIFMETVTLRDLAMSHRRRAAGGALMAIGFLYLATSFVQT